MGYAATAACGVVLVYFIAAFAAAQILDLYVLRLVTLIASPVLAVIFISVSAYCNLKYGALMDRVISRYVQAVLVENAALLHPERDSLTFYIEVVGSCVHLRVNGYKEKIVFDFSAFGKLSFFKRAQVVTAVISRLSATFFRLYERGTYYKKVDFSVATDGKPEKGNIIFNGKPDEKAYRAYLKKSAE